MTLYYLKPHDHDWSERTEDYPDAGVSVRIRECADPECDAKHWDLAEEQSGLQEFVG